MLVWRDNKLLLIERRRPPFGFAPPAGHVDDRASFEIAAKAELLEEVGLVAQTLILVAEGKKSNLCRRHNGNWHYWKIYKAEASGSVKASKDETKRFRWCSEQQLRSLANKTERYQKNLVTEAEWQQRPGLEPIWYEWLHDLKIL